MELRARRKLFSLIELANRSTRAAQPITEKERKKTEHVISLSLFALQATHVQSLFILAPHTSHSLTHKQDYQDHLMLVEVYRSLHM